ncbi:YqiA/YcfP family alpha/beta fold hydrolase [Bernardetia sp.]|uniref:YqiA/YcfP family alpha/beta fold hydrolase n=1 Tax=Bernardetia sp. TaxID=1937974 RepID=UPI0025B96715|nr:YqiA/YcfP family alpha/beta fold hydrolase [Bernardetia sp.]
MKTLWLHGMGASPNQEKIKLLESYGFEMYALHLKYNQDSFDILKEYCLKNEITFLVGSSHGGFLGFWLSEELALPCLLLNPAVSLRGKNKTKPKNMSKLESPLCIVALGEEDKQIDPKRTLVFMEKDKREDKEIITKTWAEEGHGFTMKAFKEIVTWAKDILTKHT